MKKRLRPFFSYFGSKWILSPHYPAPEHERIVEPFAGSACYSLLYPDHNVILTDLNEEIVDTWKFLINASEEDILSLPDVFEDVRDVPDLSDGARNLIGFWLSPGSTSPRNKPTAFARKGHETGGSHLGWYKSGAERIKERILSQLPYIRHWKVGKRDYRALPSVEATWFVDPPYQLAGHHYPVSDLCYDHLAGWCKERSGQVIVCEAQGANWLPFRFLREVPATPSYRKTGKKQTSKEVVWTNSTEGESE